MDEALIANREPSKVLHRSLATGTRSALRLTRREREIVGLLMEGCTNKEIAARLRVSDQTVKNQLSTLYQKAGVGSRLELVLFAQRTGLTAEACPDRRV